MANRKIGTQTVRFENRPYIVGRGNIGGKKEGEGPLSDSFDQILDDDMFGEKSWEKAECKMLEAAMDKAMKRAQLEKDNIDIMLCGDLINQIMTSSFTARDMHIPFLGLYGACSTMTESLVIGSMLVDGGFARSILAGASSHFCTAERQFRMPVEHGNQRPTSAQWTATAAGAVVVSEWPCGITEGMPVVRATEATVGQGATMALPIWANYMRRVFSDSRLGYSEGAVFDLPEGYNPCETSEIDVTDVNDIEEVFE